MFNKLENAVIYLSGGTGCESGGTRLCARWYQAVCQVVSGCVSGGVRLCVRWY